MTTGFVPPPYPYERLGEVKAIADRLPGGAIDLSVGTPCDPPPAGGDRGPGRAGPGRGLPAVDRHAGVAGRRGRLDLPPAGCDGGSRRRGGCLRRHEGVRRLGAAVPQAAHPGQDTVLYPAISYPTYEMGAILAGLRAVPYQHLDEITDADAARALCLWVNSPNNPTGELSDLAASAGWGRRARRCRCSPTSATPSSATPAGQHHPAQRDGRGAGAALAVQAGQLRRRPDRLLRRRCRAGALPAGGAQARRPDAAGAGAARRLGGAGRRRARRGRSASGTGAGCSGCARCWPPSGCRPRCPTVRSTSGWRRPTATPGARPGCWPSGPASSASPGEFYGAASTGYLRMAAVAPDDRIELAASRVGLA